MTDCQHLLIISIIIDQKLLKVLLGEMSALA
jgi:hypothetical protein